MSDSIDEIGSSLEESALGVLDLGVAKGADRVKCVMSAGVESRLVVENGDFSIANTKQSHALGVGVHSRGRKGSASTNSLDQAGIEHAVEEAMALASFSLPDGNLVMADTAQADSGKPLSFLYSQDVAGLDLAGIGGLMTQAVERFNAESRFALDRFEVSSNVSYHGMVNSLGVRQSERQTTLGWSYLGMARSGDQVSGMDYQGGFSFNLNGIAEKMLGDIDVFLARVLGCLNPIKCPAFKGPIVIAPRALSQLLISPLLYHASGRSVMDGKSRWSKSVGQQVVSDKLTVSDEPHSRELIGSTSYDSDGLPTKRFALFQQGVLGEHLQDLYSAKKLGVAPTGTAGGPFGLCVAAGNTSFEEMVNSSPKVLYVTRFSGNLDSLTGDFSGLAKSSRLYVAGEDKGPVGETMIAGNVFDMANNIISVGKCVENVGGSYIAPSVMVDGVTVS